MHISDILINEAKEIQTRLSEIMKLFVYYRYENDRIMLIIISVITQTSLNLNST